MKMDSEKQDREARTLRVRANKDYDASQELTRKVGILTQKVNALSVHAYPCPAWNLANVSFFTQVLFGYVLFPHTIHPSILRMICVYDNQADRIDSTISQDDDLIRRDTEDVKHDRARINAALVLQKQIGQHRADERKALANLNKAKAILSIDEKRITRDDKRERQQASRANMLLRRAEAEANQARSALVSAQKLRLSSETEVQTSGGSQEAASDFEQAKGKEGMSRKATSQALDSRSKSRLAQELAAVLRTMVAKDKSREEVDKSRTKEMQRKEDETAAVVRHDEREERRHPLHKLENQLRTDMLSRSRSGSHLPQSKLQHSSIHTEKKMKPFDECDEPHTPDFDANVCMFVHILI